jgi:IS5 family transposase
LAEPAVTIERTGTVVAQARTRLAGQTPQGATRLVSLHDPDARPVRKGCIGKPVEFGYKAQVADNDEGIILGYGVELGAGALAACQPRSPPTAATASLPSSVTCRNWACAPWRSPARPTTSAARKTIEHSRGFHRLVKWRTGSEGRISHLKRSCGWDRTRLDGRPGAAIWCGYGVFAHNLVKIGALPSQPARAKVTRELAQAFGPHPRLIARPFRSK